MAVDRRPDFAELVRRGVIDPRTLPRPLRREVADDLRRRADDLLRRQRERDASDIPF